EDRHVQGVVALQGAGQVHVGAAQRRRAGGEAVAAHPHAGRQVVGYHGEGAGNLLVADVAEVERLEKAPGEDAWLQRIHGDLQLARHVRRARNEQECERVRVPLDEAIGADVPRVTDAGSLEEVPGRIPGWRERVQIVHHAVLPEDG